MKIAVVSLNKKGDVIASTIVDNINADIYSKTKIADFNLKSITEGLMQKYQALVFVSSTGIAVRAIAPYIKSKDKDPAVIVIDVLGKQVISLLSGHLGGANCLSLKLSSILGAVPVITTATDMLKIKAPDIIARENNLIIDSLKDAKDISALLVDGEKVAFVDEKNRIPVSETYVNLLDIQQYFRFENEELYRKQNNEELESKNTYLKSEEEGCCKNSFNEEIQGYYNNNLEKILVQNYSLLEKVKGIVYVTDKARIHSLNKYPCIKLKQLKLIRKDIVLGLGCKKNYPAEIMIKQVCERLKELNIDRRSIKYVSTVEIKKDEKAILQLNEFLNSELRIFTKDAIKEVQHKYKGSDFVEKSIGIRAVCEPCVELSGGDIFTEKISLSGMTLCVGKI